MIKPARLLIRNLGDVSRGLKILRMPCLSPSMEKGQILAWHTAPGDRVEAYHLVLDVRGFGLLDKNAGADDFDGDMEVEIMEDGTIAKLLHQVGDVVNVNAPIAILCEEEDNLYNIEKLSPENIAENAMWQAYKKP